VNTLKHLPLLLLFFSAALSAETSYLVKHVDSMPVIDGDGSDEQWTKATDIQVIDVIANHEIHFAAIHDGESIAIRIQYPDQTENRDHKALIWNDSKGMYETGPSREDTVVLKWPINPMYKDIRLNSNEPYQADIWYWKSFRTDPVGFADDKIQIYSKIPNKKATRLRSQDGSLFFLQRRGDSGSSSYQTRVLLDKEDPQQAKYDHRQPSGSRADIRAKGQWKDGVWTVELLRKLDTGNDDDVRLGTEHSSLLGLSRYEIAGRKPDPSIQEPNFGSGEVGALIEISIEP
jgi:hypothetical protein